MPRGSRRTADEAFLIAFVGGATIENAAHTAGISRRTAHRRLKDPAFQERVRAVRDDLVQRTAGTLAAASAEAVKTLLSLQQESVPASVRLAAAVRHLGNRLENA